VVSVRLCVPGFACGTSRRTSAAGLSSRRPSESAFDYFRTRAYLEEHGKPVAFYSDKHGIFRVNRKEAASGDGVTQFGRALLALNIDIICANSPQAKGRIALRQAQERVWHVAGPHGQGAAAGGGILDCRGERMAAWVHRRLQQALRPRSGERQEPALAKAGDLHRPLAPADDLDEILAWREERTVTAT
jgi:hypothetical protein